MTKINISVSIEEKLLKKLDEYISRRLGNPSRSSIIETALELYMYKLWAEEQTRKDISVVK